MAHPGYGPFIFLYIIQYRWEDLELNFDFFYRNIFHAKGNGQIVTSQVKVTTRTTMVYNFLPSKEIVSDENIIKHSKPQNAFSLF